MFLALNEAQKQMSTQAKVLFSSLRFLNQDLLLATTGEYYSLAVLQRNPDALLDTPTGFHINQLIRTLPICQGFLWPACRVFDH